MPSYRVEVKNFERYQRPESQSGTWILAQHIKILEVLKRGDSRK